MDDPIELPQLKHNDSKKIADVQLGRSQSILTNASGKTAEKTTSSANFKITTSSPEKEKTKDRKESKSPKPKTTGEPTTTDPKTRTESFLPKRLVLEEANKEAAERQLEHVAKQATKERTKDLGTNHGRPLPNEIFEVELKATIALPQYKNENLDFSCLVFDQLGEFMYPVFWDNQKVPGISLRNPKLIALDFSRIAKGESKISNQSIATTLIFAITIPVPQVYLKGCDYTCVIAQRDRGQKTPRTPKTPNQLTERKSDWEFVCKWGAGHKVGQKIENQNTMFVCRIYRDTEKWRIQNLVNHYTLKFEGSLSSLFYVPVGQPISTIIPLLSGNENIVSLPAWTTLNIRIIRGHQFIVRDFTGKSDPYVKVFTEAKAKGEILEKKHGGAPIIRNFVHKTATIQNTLNPEWPDEKFEISFSDATTLTGINFVVKDRDFFGKSEALGSCTIELSKLQPNVEVTRWFALALPQKKKDKQEKKDKKKKKEEAVEKKPQPVNPTAPASNAKSDLVCGSLLISVQMVSPHFNVGMNNNTNNKDKKSRSKGGNTRRGSFADKGTRPLSYSAKDRYNYTKPDPLNERGIGLNFSQKNPPKQAEK